MANYYNEQIKFEMESSPLMQRIAELKERDYADKDTDAQFYQRIADAQTQQQTGGECA